MEKEGYKITSQANSKFKVNVFGIPQALKDDDGIDEDLFEEDIQTDRDHLNFNEPVHAVTVSQSLGVDPSVDSLALDDYDHIEPVG